MGKLNSELPANPWVVWQDGNYPTPTVRAAEEEPDSNPDPDPIAPAPVGVVRAWIENVVDDGTTLHALFTDQDNKASLYSVDVNTAIWTLRATPPQDLVWHIREAATTAYNGRLYLLLYHGPGWGDNREYDGELELYEYEPVGDTWAKVANWDIAGAYPGARAEDPHETYHFRCAHLAVGADGRLYAVAPGGDDTGSRAFVFAVDPSDGSVTYYAGVGGPRAEQARALAAYSLADDGDIVLHVITGDGYHALLPYGSAEQNAYYEPLAAQLGSSLGMRAVLPAHNRVYLGNARTTAGQQRLGRNSYVISQALCWAGMGASLYVVERSRTDQGYSLTELPTHPCKPGTSYFPSVSSHLVQWVVGDEVNVRWEFDDPDRPDDEQSAYRVVIETDAGVEVADTGKVAGSTYSYTKDNLAEGGYRARVWVWDDTDQISPEGSENFYINPPIYEDDPPTATITAPLNGATVTGDTDVLVAANDDLGVVSVAVFIDGTLLGRVSAPNSGDYYGIHWRVAGWADGQHSLVAIATDTSGQTGSHSIVVNLDVREGDTEAPVVTITAPPASGTVHGVVTVKATATDNVGVVRVNLYVDGQLQDGLTAPNDGAGYAFTWDTEGWANGPRTLRVVAYDPAGNWGYAERTVTVDRAKALATLYLFTEQMPTAAVADRWRPDLRFRRGLLTCLAREPAPADPKERYQVTVGVHVPGDSVNFADYQRIDPDRVHGFTGEGNTCRWALCAVPSFTEAFWELDAEAAFRFIVLPSGPPALLTTGDNGLWHMVGGRYALWEALTGITTLADGAYFDGQIACLGGAAFVLKDVDTGELTWQAMLPGATGYSAVAADAAGGYLLVGATTAAGAAVYRFAYQALTKIGDLPAAVTRVALAGGVGAIGCADGVAYRWAGGSAAPTLLVDTETDGIWSICDSGGVTYLGTGDLGAVWASMPAWHEDTTLGAGRVRALAVWQGALWAAGLGDGALWRMQNGVWSQWHVFDGVTVIDDLLVDAQDRLWVAATHSGGARVYRLEVAAGGDFESGPEPPDVLAKIVRAV
jgi:hypothetical protein